MEKVGELIERERKKQGADEFMETFNQSQPQKADQKNLHSTVQLKQRVKTAGNGTRYIGNQQNFNKYKSAVQFKQNISNSRKDGTSPFSSNFETKTTGEESRTKSANQNTFFNKGSKKLRGKKNTDGMGPMLKTSDNINVERFL